MNCTRAVEVLRGLAAGELRNVESEEIDEILSLNLAVEVDPEDLTMVAALESTVREHAGTTVVAPDAVQAVANALHATEERLRSDWWRIKANKTEIAAEETHRIALRRAVALLNDRDVMTVVVKLAEQSRQLAPGARYVAAPLLGTELYALTHKGFRVRGQLEARMARFGELPLKSFLQSFDKAEAKMFAFANDISKLAAGIGYVKKNPHQVVIGLAKAGGPPAKALQAYQYGKDAVSAPDRAVACARHAATYGTPEEAAKRLREAEAALRRAGYPPTPIVQGAAKSLLGFALQPGVLRFVEIHRRLQQVLSGGEMLIKYTARLMSATGTPVEVVGRVATAVSSLVYQVPSSERARPPDVRAAAVALAAMVKTQAQVPEIVARFRALEAELVRTGISTLHTMEDDALECIGCPGTPAEVAATVAALLGQVASGRQPQRGDVAVAVAFAKRFAY